LLQADADADRIKREADGYFTTKTFESDGAFAKAENLAKGQRAMLLADAEGMEQRRLALTGEGGVNLVGLEYAKRLAGVRFSGTPIAREPQVQQFSVQPASPAAGENSSRPSEQTERRVPIPAVAPSANSPVTPPPQR
jgi:hypothetical protein